MPETPTHMAARSKAWVCGLSLAEIAGLNTAVGPWMCVDDCCVLSGTRSLRRADHSSRGLLLSVVCLRWGLHEATVHAARRLASERGVN